MPPVTLTDAEIDARATAYAAQHGVDYLAALQVVLADTGGTRADGNTLPSGYVGDLDHRLDAEATAHMRATGVNYSEALDYVANHGAGSFSEAAIAGRALDAVQALQSQPIEIFRAGTHVDSMGATRAFTAQDVQAIASAYNLARHEAPLTIGHPETDRPAYGWVKGLTATADGRLLMQADRVDVTFAEMVKAGRYKKRSASFYPPNGPNNPTPGRWYLRHVAWLGAQPPAIQGLPDVEFSMGASDDAVCFWWG